MREKIRLIIFLLSIVILLVAIFSGIEFLKVESVKGLVAKNQELESKIEEASQLTNDDYPKAVHTFFPEHSGKDSYSKKEQSHKRKRERDR